MLKNFLRKCLYNRFMAQRLIRPVLKCHALCYRLAGRFAVILNDGRHPKHEIINYPQWFQDRIQPQWTVLDVGSNTGRIAKILSLKARKVYGIEIVPEHVQTASMQNAADSIEYICADATGFDYSTLDPIHCVVLSNILEHIRDRTAFLKKLIRAVQWSDSEHKRFLIRVPLIDRDWLVLYKKKLGLDYRLDETHETEYTIDEFEQEMRIAGLEILSIEIRFGEIFSVVRATNSK